MARLKATLGALLGFHLFWQVAAWLMNKPVLPGPIAVYAHLPQLMTRELFWHLYFSLYRIFWGLGIAAVLGVAIGILIVRVPAVGKWLDPLVYFTYPIPKIALLPVAMLLLGLGNASKITMIALIVVFQVIISVRDAVRQIPADLYQTLHLLDANRFELFKAITWPASLAAVISALRVAFGTAIATLFFTEVYGTQYGLGYFIMDEWNRLDYLGMYGGIVIISLVAFGCFLLLNGLEKITIKWHKG